MSAGRSPFTIATSDIQVATSVKTLDIFNTWSVGSNFSFKSRDWFARAGTVVKERCAGLDVLRVRADRRGQCGISFGTRKSNLMISLCEAVFATLERH
jgi:hypothetical protein